MEKIQKSTKWFHLWFTLFGMRIFTLLTACGGSAGGGQNNASETLPLSSWACQPTHQALTAVDYTQNPLWGQAWHLKNVGGGSDKKSGEDYRVSPVWEQGVTGECVVVAVVDEGLEINHEDLRNNVLPGYSFNYKTRTADPTITTQGASLYDWRILSHGTNVAGVIAAANNQAGSIGIAPNAKLMGLNILEGYATLEDTVQAMVGQVGSDQRRMAVIDISNNSWGFSGKGKLNALGQVWRNAVEKGVQEGRSGKGIIYLFAAGNDGAMGGDSNHSDTSNYRSIITVGGADATGTHPNYAQTGATVLVSGLTMGTLFATGIVTTNLSGRGNPFLDSSDNYVGDFNGTSAATPGVSGVVALMLQANPDLTWRQVRWILADSARKIDYSSGWLPSAVGSGFNPMYGFGVVDASAAVAMAQHNPPVLGALKSCEVSGVSTNQIQWITSSPTLFDFDTTGCGFQTVEFVETEVNFAHSYFGDLSIILTSPKGWESQLASPHTCFNNDGVPDPNGCNYSSGMDWIFGSVRHLGESLKGNGGHWKVGISDQGNIGIGSISSVKVVFWGF